MYEFTPGMREISGFGGTYEQGCRTMLKAALELLDERGENFNPRYHGYKGVMGIAVTDNDEAVEMDMVMHAAIREKFPGEGMTGAMHQAVVESAFWIRHHSWDEYVEKMSEEKEVKDG